MVNIVCAWDRVLCLGLPEHLASKNRQGGKLSQ